MNVVERSCSKRELTFIICVLVEPPPPKVKKPKRRRHNLKKFQHQYTMEDEYDAEEIRQTPQGLRLFRMFSGHWVEMQ